ncbi:plastocyanin/azurin family copper-binding protein [Tahibacter soli]|jgi:plastocyanin|uniref:Plastocyanin/azurin family copper-binding protein n=1 Tax=Tahibacter soli TaxID=2983605 RepID=A0A9X3YMM6_9GAMM|nr:plastocyanin/azurin family copper-binding protein [Tahibacter soli]MDC8014477.1 plastocyanin/azurin family copper-binding protein [Tahibacter soli]
MKGILKQWLVGVLLLAAGSVATAANHTVRVGGGGLTFTPSTLTIQRGDTVTFSNAGGFHNVVADSGAFRCAAGCDGAGGNGNLSSAGWSATVAFNTAGTFGYFCDAHGAPGSGMAGTIIVQGGDPPFTITPAITGNWYDPAQNGHGFQFEMITPTLVTAFWFTFDNAGNPAWLVGTGTIDGGTIVMQVNRSSGGRFPPNFNPASIVNNPWGTWTFTITGCNAGKVDWTTTDPAFTATGTMTLTRLTQIQGMSCP